MVAITLSFTATAASVLTVCMRQIDVLRRMNYRGANVANINDDRVVEELLKP